MAGPVALAAFKDRHRGQPAVILANGATLKDHDLSRLSCRTIGINRSYDLHDADYHVCLERAHALRDPEAYVKMARAGKLFVAGEWEIGHVMPILSERITRFSRDIPSGVVTQVREIGSVSYAALQLAAWLGFSPILFLGLDLAGGHFHGDWPASKTIHRQRELFLHTPPDIARAVYVVGSPNSKAPFNHLTYDEALAKMPVLRRLHAVVP